MNSPTATFATAATIGIEHRLASLRVAMREKSIDALVIPSADPHLSEYLPGRWQGREVFSGFTGSVGTLVVTTNFAGLWVDSRYWSQAEKELAGSGIQMMKIMSAAATLHIDWLAEQLQAGQTVAIDGNVLGLATARLMQQAFATKQIQLITHLDLLAQVWADRPTLPIAPIYEHAMPFAVRTRADKLTLLREQMHAQNVQWHFISTVDDIAWLFNLRGADVSYNPVFIAHALVGQTQATLFIKTDKVPDHIRTALNADGIQIEDYDHAATALAALPADSRLLIDPRRVTFGFRQQVPASVTVVEAINPTVLAKSRKTEQEAAFVRKAMEQDGAALCEFFSWLELNLGKQTITELTIDEQVCAARAKQAHYISPSFGTIAGFNGNGAMPHYRATAQSHATIEGDGLLLIDSGGQYLNGTTDITRVAPIGKVSAEQKQDFTLVLKGMIALSRMRFPRGTYSTALDVVARAPMWAKGINYGHGTGHGVGYFLNVHEGPQSISSNIPDTNMIMQAGMITSNEPGIYRPGQWGVRIENLLLCVDGQDSEFGSYLKFETLTLCPIDTRCIDLNLMQQDEIDWLNDYHATVHTRLSPLVQGAALEWLIERTKAV